MSTSILSTKLYIPPPRPNLVLRPSLIERLNKGLQSKLTVVSAPAGFGKTTLVCEWVAGSERSTAWLSLDERDSDITRFLTYLVAALRNIAPHIGEEVVGLLQSPQPPSSELILTTLLNDITSLSETSLLVLDDYHVVEAKAIDDALAFLLEHLPPQMHLVMTTREDPNLPLARYRARGQLTELRATDLRFTPAEAAGFFNQVMGLELSVAEIATLETRTEGWVAGLQMAAISMQGREDVSGFIKAFAGDNRYIVDYLLEEVLQRQPQHVCRFLLQTSILDRLSGPLCDAVIGAKDSQMGGQGDDQNDIPNDAQSMLEILEHGNLFVIPLDDKRQWYRYHHLFADVLQARVRTEQPDLVPLLHQRASSWYEQSGLRADAIRHALAANDFEQAADLVELAARAILMSYEDATLLGWVKALPGELVSARPVLSVACAWALLDRGELEAAEAHLRDAERWLETAASLTAEMVEEPTEHSEVVAPEIDVAETVVVDEEQLRSLPANIAAARAYHAQALGDVPGTEKYTRRALDLLPDGDHFHRGNPAAILGLAYWASGDLEAAHRSFADGMTSLRMSGNILSALSGTFVLADIKITQGRLHEAVSTYEQSLQLATEQGKPVLRGTSHLYVGLSELYRERNDLEAAMQLLLTAEELGEHAGLHETPYRRCVALARIKEAQGDLEGALDLLRQAEHLVIRGPVPDVRPVAALMTRVWVKLGRLTEALSWAREQGLAADDDLSYLREFEHITLARVLIAYCKNDRIDSAIQEAVGLLERLLQAAEEGGRTGSVIEILVLQALVFDEQGDSVQALGALAEALQLGKPEGYVRVFVDEGAAIVPLLRRAASQGIETKYVTTLLQTLHEENAVIDIAQPLVEPLSQRELELLALVADGLSNQQIADELIISIATTKKHMSNILGKLSANNRTEAVRRAQDLQLL